MIAIWTYESINGKPNFCKAEIYAIVASVLLWKHFNPTHTTKFYCDKIALKYFQDKNILNIFDEIDSHTLSRQTTINKSVFWASNKIRAINNETAPLVHIDLDLFCFENIAAKGFFKNDISVSHIEDSQEFYLPYEDAYKGVKIDFPKKTKVAYNTSILFIKDEFFKMEYCKISINYMHFASKQNLLPIHSKNKSLYMTFAEQKLLADLAIQNHKKVGTMVKNIMDCGTGDFTKNMYENGLDELVETEKYMVHFGSFKQSLKQSKKLQKRVINHILFLFDKYNINFQFKSWWYCETIDKLSTSLFKK